MNIYKIDKNFRRHSWVYIRSLHLFGFINFFVMLLYEYEFSLRFLDDLRRETNSRVLLSVYYSGYNRFKDLKSNFA